MLLPTLWVNGYAGSVKSNLVFRYVTRPNVIVCGGGV